LFLQKNQRGQISKDACGSLHLSLPFNQFAKQSREVKSRKSKKKYMKIGFLHEICFKTARLCVLRIYIHPYIYLIDFRKLHHRKWQKDEKVAI
jgi:hypothetical protein